MLGCADARTQCCHSIRPLVCRWSVQCVVGNCESIFCLRDDTRKVAIALPFDKVVGLQNCEYPPNFVFKVVNGFRCDDSGNPHDGILLHAAWQAFLHVPFLVLLDILPLLVEAVAGQFLLLFCCVLGGERLILVIIY
jgi:hypothetical protein